MVSQLATRAKCVGISVKSTDETEGSLRLSSRAITMSAIYGAPATGCATSGPLTPLEKTSQRLHEEGLQPGLECGDRESMPAESCFKMSERVFSRLTRSGLGRLA